MEEGHPIACISKPLSPRNQTLSAHEKKLLDVVSAIRTWRAYLGGKHFLIRTYYFSLKYIWSKK